MGIEPESVCDAKGVNPIASPPRSPIAATVDFAVIEVANGHCERELPRERSDLSAGATVATAAGNNLRLVLA